jgi:hypothetical protein
MRRTLWLALLLCGIVLLSFSVPARAQGRGQNGEPSVIKVISLSSQNAEDVGQAFHDQVGNNFGGYGAADVRVAVGNKLLVSGSKTAVEQAEAAIAELDKPTPLVRPIRIRTTEKVTVTGVDPAPRTFENYSESVGAEGSTVYSNLGSQLEAKVKTEKGEQSEIRNTSAHTELIALVEPDGSISLNGKGGFSYEVPPPGRGQVFKDYTLSAAAPPRQAGRCRVGRPERGQGQSGVRDNHYRDHRPGRGLRAEASPRPDRNGRVRRRQYGRLRRQPRLRRQLGRQCSFRAAANSRCAGNRPETRAR